MAERADVAWERRYAAGWALNAYPFDVIVSLTMKYFAERDTMTGLTVLDLGSGAANHALFFARLGFDVTCIDVSPSAHAIARSRFAAEGLTARFHCMRLEELDSLDGTYDLVLDRIALSHLDQEVLRTRVMPAIRRRLRPTGLFFSCFLSGPGPKGPDDPPLEPAPTTVPSDDAMSVRITRLDRSGIEDLFTGFRIVQLYHHVVEELRVAVGEPALGASAEYIVVCRAS